MAEEVQRYINTALVHFTEDECGLIVIEGILVIVSFNCASWYVLCVCGNITVVCMFDQAVIEM